MAESKRIFNSGKINRDIDDRLLPPGSYRDALNVNVGESEGGDIGALENVKGNSIVAGQTGISGTTIGVIKDPNADRVYWFNTSDTADGVYEYDQSTGNVNVLLQDIKRDVPLPTCAPDITIAAIEPDSITPNRPNLPGLPTEPVGQCTDSRATNNITRDLGPREFTNNGLCTYLPTSDCSGAPNYICTERSDGGGQFMGNDCGGTCEEPGPPPSRTSLTVSGCPSTAVTDPSFDLMLTAANFDTGDFPMDVPVSNHGTVTLTANGSETFTVTSGSGQVMYTPSGADENTGCTIGWGVAPPAVTFNCVDNNTPSARCVDPGDGSGSFTGATAMADCTAGCTATTPVTLTCNTIRYNNPSGNNPAVFAFFQCNNTCNFTFRNIAAGTSGRACVQPTFTTECSGMSTTQSIGGGVNVTTQGGFSFTDTLGGTTGIPGATTTSTGLSCTSDADNP